LQKRIHWAFIYGSVARAEELAISDVDLMIIGKVGLAEVAPALHRAEKRLSQPAFPEPSPQGTPDTPTVPHPAPHVQAARCRSTPGSGALRRGCRAAPPLGARAHPGAAWPLAGSAGERQGARARCRRKNAVCFSYPSTKAYSSSLTSLG
jgi:hypothetical protein